MSGIATGNAKDGERGFTLIELLVVLALLGLISLAMVGALRFGLRAWDTGERRVEQLNRIQAVQGFLRQRIHQALPTPRRADRTEPATTFAGTMEELRFTAPLPAHLGVGGLHVYALRLDEDGRRMVLDWRLYRPEESESAEATGTAQLLDDVESMTLSYFGASRDGADPDWHDDAEWSAGLPDLVRLRVTFPAGDARHWPELVVAPKRR
jgi:general secretion pathway protein J